MKRVLAWLLIALLVGSVFSGCSKNEPSLKEAIQQNTSQAAPVKPGVSAGNDQPGTVPPAKEEKPDNETAVGGELYDAGNVTVLIPEGWTAFPEKDVFADDEDTMNPDVLNVSKGGKTELDLFSKPYVRINYFGPDITMMKPDASWYEDVEDMEPFATGAHTWNGFFCTSLGTALAFLWCEEGEHQYQATLTLGSGTDTITPEDSDVRAILASVTPSDPNAASGSTEEDQPEEEPTAGFWNGQWYGWWCIRYANGAYEEFNDIAWDAYAEIDDYEDGTGYITLWDSETSKASPLIRGYVEFDDYGVMTSDYCTFFDCGQWLPEAVSVVPMDIEDWYVDPETSTVSHFENMIDIMGYYEDPDNEENYFTYNIYLRPWGTDWEDVRNGDTSGCIYSDMMPILYDDWYVPLMDIGAETLPSSTEEGWALIEDTQH